MKLAIAQIAPVVLDRRATLDRVIAAIHKAADQDCSIVVFGETLVPAYPFWLCRTDAARFNAKDQKEIFAEYLKESVSIPMPGFEAARHDLVEVCDTAKDRGISVMLGVAECAVDRGGHSIYCSRVFIEGFGNQAGEILSVHRKLMPTYEERLSWSPGDGAGLVTHDVGPFKVGGLNCWENWLPLARAALYAAGEDLHVMLWPGCQRLTQDITRFIALESRSYVVSASSVIRAEDVPETVPYRDQMLGDEQMIYDGGSCIAGPDGEWLVEPIVGKTELIVAELNHDMVLRERQNMDSSGHYGRPDVLQLKVNRRRQSAAEFES